MSKNFGTAVSGYLDPTGRNWETVVMQAGKPVLDKELNLSQDLDNGSGQVALRTGMPSGWVSEDFLSTSGASSVIFDDSTVANRLKIPNGLVAHVNGWLLRIQETGTTGNNFLDLGAGPSGNGVRRTDLVVLEVWRRLIAASPSALGKSAAGRIWQQGNVKTDPSNDVSLNYVDDLLDTNVGSETAKRVQIQYRLRVIHGVDVFATPYAMDDPTVVANSVPVTAGAPDGVATAFQYANQSLAGDQGLWLAGDGNPANTLGTVDGYMYAIPLMAVFRRNTTAFDRRLNQNGGVATPGPSDRPDGLFSNVIDARDILDLRSGVSPTGWNYSELLEKNTNLLFDNRLRTEIISTSPFGGGCEGVTVFAADEIGVSDAHGGDGTSTGTTGVGQFIGEFDAARRFYSDRSVYEVVSVKIPVPGGGWVNNATVSIDPTALPIYPYAAFNWASYNSNTVMVHDVVGATWIGAATKKTLDATPYITSVTNLAVMPVVTMVLKLGTIASLSLTNEPLFVDLLIAYPPGLGLHRTPTDDYGNASFEINNPGALPGSSPISYGALVNQSIDASHREVQLQYRTSNITVTQAADTSISGADSFRLPERALSINGVLKNTVAIAGSVTLDATGRVATFTNPADYTNPGDTLAITYRALRPLPQNAAQVTVYYERRAPQAARTTLLGTSLQLLPRYVAPHLFAITCGSGSQDEGYPFPQAYVQTGGIYKTSALTYNGESELAARADIAVSDFNATTGFLRLPLYIPMVANPESIVFTRGSGDVDVEDRSFFPTFSGGYIPNAYAQDLSDPKIHKDAVPMICELVEDSPLGFQGQLVLVLLLRYALFDETNGVFFNADLTQNTTVASVFRLKGNLLNKRVV